MRAFIASRIRNYLEAYFAEESGLSPHGKSRGNKSGIYVLQNERVIEAQREYLKRVEQTKRPIAV